MIMGLPTGRCEVCGDPFQLHRQDTKYCSSACKQKAYRKRHHLDWGHGPNLPVPTFTEEEIRVVLDIHHPTHQVYYNDMVCSCAPQWVPREKCYYCDAKVNQDDPKATIHKDDCRILPMLKDHPDMGVLRQHYTEFNADHLMERLHKLREIAGDYGRQENQHQDTA